MPSPLITVLMPVHNGAAYLAEAICSMQRQTVGDFELLIVDDASTDHSLDIIRQITDPRIRLIESRERLKLSGALNLGLDQARGRFVARMDADDISLPHRLERQARFLDQHPDIGFCGSWIRLFGAGPHHVLRRPTTPALIHAFTLFDSPFAHPTVMLRRESFERHQLRFDGTYFPTEDFELWARALKCFPAANLPEVLLRYRVHGKSLTGSDWSTMDDQAIRVIRRQLDPLGLELSEDSLRFHRQLGMGRMSITRPVLDRAEQWLTGIRDANRRTGVFEAGAMDEILGDVWFRANLHGAHLGFAIPRRYRNSALAGTDPRRLSRTAWIALAALKNRVVRR